MKKLKNGRSDLVQSFQIRSHNTKRRTKMGLRQFIEESEKDQRYPVTRVGYAGTSYRFPGLSQFNLKVKTNTMRKRRIFLLVPWKVERAESTCLKRIEKDGKLHLILGLSPKDARKIKGKMHKKGKERAKEQFSF